MDKKITAQGPRDRKSFTITLPIEWVKEQGLDKTRQANLEIVNNKIIIGAKKDSKEFKVNANNFDRMLVKVLVWLYRFGASNINIKFSDKKSLRDIRKVLDKKIIGFEVIEQTSNSCVIRDITRESANEFKTVLRRAFLLIIQLAEGFESEEKPEIESMEQSIDKLTAFCQRLLMLQGHTDFLKIPYYYQVCTDLEHLGDDYSALYSLNKKVKAKNYMNYINKLLRETYNLMYNFDEKKYTKTEVLLSNIYNKIKSDFYNTNSNKIELYFLLSITRELRSILGNILIINFKN
jgi:hypothetical protein